jgi:Holliday junction resolvase RusA-like endonuclease
MTKFNVSNISYDIENNTLEFIMMGPITVQARPKITYRSRNQPVYYDPSHNDKKLWKAALCTALVQQVSNQLPIFEVNHFNDNGIELHLQFFEKRPKLDFDKTGNLKSQYHQFPYQRDVDNMVKFVMDAMLGVTYKDDSSVVKIVCEKFFIDSKSLSNQVADQEKVVVIIRKK